MTRLYLVSPFPAVRAGLRTLLGGAGGYEVAGELPAWEALAEAGASAADVVILDAAPGVDAADLAMTRLAGPGDEPGLVLLGPVAGDEHLPALFAGRPWAYLPREAGADQL